MDVLAAAAVADSDEYSAECSGEQPGRADLSSGWHRGRHGGGRGGGGSSSGDSPPPSATAAGGGGGGGASKTKAAVAAQVAEAHGGRIATEAAGALAQWTAEVQEQLVAADNAFVAARDAHQAVGAASCLPLPTFLLCERTFQCLAHALAVLHPELCRTGVAVVPTVPACRRRLRLVPAG
jgi:hypothetical protein